MKPAFHFLALALVLLFAAPAIAAETRAPASAEKSVAAPAAPVPAAIPAAPASAPASPSASSLPSSPPPRPMPSIQPAVIYGYPGSACPPGSVAYTGPEVEEIPAGTVVYCEFKRKYMRFPKEGPCPIGFKDYTGKVAPPEGMKWCVVPPR